MARFCPDCGSSVTGGMYICPRCSSPLPAASAPPVATATRRDIAYAPVWSAADLLRMQRAMAYPKAPLMRRFVAAFIDAGLLAATAVPGGIVAGMGEAVNNYPITEVGMVVIFLGLFGGVIYEFAKDGREGGKSLGKEAMGLMVVHLPDNTPATTRQSAIRTLMLPLLGWLVEPLLSLFSESGRRVGDRLADTQVIRESDYRP